MDPKTSRRVVWIVVTVCSAIILVFLLFGGVGQLQLIL